MSNCKIIKCTCKNEYQDKKYGLGMRVCNAKFDAAKNGYACTVCGNILKPENK